MEIEIFDEGFSKKSLPKKIPLFPYNELQLVEGLTQENVRADLIANLLSSEFRNWDELYS